jgi:tetratricopeptide (TPR) repeat protein
MFFTKHITIPLLLTTSLFSPFLCASDEKLELADIAIQSKNYDAANRIYQNLLNEEEFQLQALLGQAKIAFYTNKLDAAEALINRALEKSSNPDIFFWAGRVAGAQAKEANIFSQLSYARNAKNFFVQALELNPEHEDSIVGLIRFHQQAPSLAGGEKEDIPQLIKTLRKVNAVTAFDFEAPRFLQAGKTNELHELFKKTLIAPETKNREQFKYDYAMSLSNYGHYSDALDILLTIDDTNNPSLSFNNMRLYQLGKLSAEANRELNIGLKSIVRYQALPNAEKTIPSDWVDFRIAQIKFLRSNENKAELIAIKTTTQDESLQNKIDSFLERVEGAI